MKRKIFSTLFALVLACSLSLVTAVPSQVAAEGSEEVTLVATHAGIAEWSIAQQHIGDYSIHLVAPGKCDWDDWAGTYADALIQIPLEGTTLEGLTLNEIVDMSWWNYLVNGYPPALRIKLDVDGDGSSDYHLVAEFAYQEWDGTGFAYTGTPWVPYTHYKPGLEATNDFYYPTYDTWMQTFHTTDNVSGARPDDTETSTVHSDTIFWVMVVGGVYGVDWHSAPYANLPSYFATLNDYKTSAVSNLDSSGTLPVLGDAKVLMLEFAITNEIGLTGDPAGHEVYFTDLTINGEPYPLELPPGPLTVDDDRAENPDAYFQTIQGAIDCAVAGETIVVAAGTYEENIVVDKSLTIQAASSPVIDGGGNLGPGVHITAANVTFQGFTITNFTCTPTAGIGALLVEGDGAIIDDNTIYDIVTTGDPINDPAGIGIDVHASNVEVTNNIVHDVGSIGIRVRHDWDTAPTVSNNVLLENNEVYRTANTGVLVTGYAKGVTVRQNEIYESLEPTEYSLFVHYGAEDVLIENNIIRDPYDSIYGHNVVLAGCDNVTISGNAITGATSGKNIYILSDYAPWVDSEMLSTNTTITNNDIQNGKWGVRISNAGATDASDMAATTTINFNNISGNTEYGVENAIATSVDAEDNWWGNASGPVPATPPPGYDSYGDAVSTKVDPQPWLLEQVTEAVPEPPTFDKTLALKDKWTLASTDKEVAAGTAWVGTTAFDDDSTIVAYKYTAGPSGGYTQVTLATQLTSVDAYYIKTASGGGVGINYSTTGAPGVVTKTLGAGWNIISCAAETDAYTLLSQLRYVQVGEQQGTGLTTLIGQGGYNQYLATTISITLVTDAEWTAIATTPVTLNAFDGYWVQMNAGKSFGVIPD